MITFKKQIDQEKQENMKRQAEELENLKNQMRTKQIQDEERRELQTLRMQMMTL